MTFEYAAYFRIMLLCGYQDELQQYIDNALIAQDPLSDIILELATAGSDPKVLLSVLNDFLRQAEDSDIDWDNTVFDQVMSFLKRQYDHNHMPMRDLTDLMYRLALCTERFHDEPWSTMYYMSDIFVEAEAGFVDQAYYQQLFDGFLRENVCFRDYPPPAPKESVFQRIRKWIRRSR